MRKLLLLTILSLVGTALWAVPANNSSFKHTMPDGTEVSLRLMGDEHMHYFINETTLEKMLMAEDGSMYAIDDTRFETMQKNGVERRNIADKRRAATMNKAKRVGETGHITGQKKGIVLLVNFADKALNAANTQEVFYNMFNQEGYNQNNQIGSVADYYKAQSYGQFELDFDVVGPLTVSKNMSYYGQNNGNGNDMHAAEMVREACQLADEQVNFADYDWDGDGWVDQVYCIYAGYAESSGADANTIWPHEWDFYSAGEGVLGLDNVYINTYACSSELSGTNGSSRNGIGTACHEFSHCLGYPDFYDIDYSGGIGVNAFDIMSGGSYNGPYGKGEVPCGFSAYERWMAGWLEPIELTDPQQIEEMPALNDEGKAYIVYNDKNRNEYFLLENRQSRGWFRYFNNSTAGHGLLIYHVDYSQNSWQMNTPNDDPDHQRMTWVPADKKYGTYYSQYKQWSISGTEARGDFFPGTSKIKVFNPNDYGSYGGKWFNKESDGSYFSKHFLSLITETDGKISFKFDMGDNGNRYTVTYHAGDGVCDATSWKQTTSSVEATTLPGAISWDSNWRFAGWHRSMIETVVVEQPELLLEGSSFLPTEDVTLYAVYSYIPAEGFWTSLYSGANMQSHTITFIAGDGTCATQTMTQSKPYEPLTLPTADIDHMDWTFAGWASTAMADTAAFRPALLEAGLNFVPGSDTTLYAIYKMTFRDIEIWRLTKPSADMEAGVYAILSPDYHTFIGNLSMGHGKVSNTTAAFNEEGETSELPEGTCELTFVASGDGFTMYNETLGYLYAKSSSPGSLAWHDTESSCWKFNKNNWTYDACSANLRSFNNKSFRTYPGLTGNEILFARKVSGSEVLYFHKPIGHQEAAIEQVELENGNAAGIYSLEGRKIDATLEQLPSGIYIINRKKITLNKRN